MSRSFSITALLTILCLAALIACGGDDDGVKPETDTIVPAAITDLTCIDRTDVSVTLSWTATGDDTTSGTARSYQIRYSLTEINTANWSSATAATGAPTPKAAGSAETHQVSGLSSNETYYFAIKAADETPNWSAVSNSPDTTTDVPGLFAITTDQWINHSPAYSPDGTMIAFVSNREGQGGEEIWIKSATVTDGPATRITTFSNSGVYYSQSPSWSPTGDSLVFHSNVLGSYDIWGVDISGNPPYTPFHIAVDQSHTEEFPEWSHDGSKIAFCSDQTNPPEIFYVSPVGGTWTQVTNDAYYNRYPTWSPDGLYIAYASIRASQNESIFKIRLSDKTIEQVSFEANQEQHPSWAPVRLWSNDYEFVAYIQNSSKTNPASRWNVSFVPSSSGVSGAILVTSATDGRHQNFPCWSPDGKRIAYTSWIEGGNTYIYTQRVFQ